MRLVESHDRIADAGPERGPQAPMGRLFHRRQPRHQSLAGICAQGWRHRARDADPGRGERMEDTGFGMQRHEQRDHARAVETHHDLWQGGRSRSEARAASRRQAEGSEGLEARRQKRETPRYHSQDHRQDDLWHRCQDARNAAIKACPVFGGKLKSFDEGKVRDMKGVRKVVKVGDSAVAVVADTWWHAKTALEALPIDWDEGDNAKVSSASIAKWLEQGLDPAQPAFVGNQNGEAKAAIARAAKKVEAVYNYPYQNHAAMEPLNATALYTADRCEVWCGTQNGEAAFAAVLEASGLPADKCEVHKQMLGGGFGRRGMTDYVRQAVTIAKQMPGTPVKLLWSREEDMLHGA